MSKLNILLLSNRPTKRSQAGTVFDHLNSFHKYSIHKILELSTIHSIPNTIDLDRFDVIVVHYTLGIGFEHFINNKTKSQLGRSKAIKVVFIQDEYRIIDKVIESMVSIDVDILFTAVPETEIYKVYSKEKFLGVKIVTNLCGYVPESFTNIMPPEFHSRPIDVGYRSRKTPFWLGKLGVDKWIIVDKFLKYCKDEDLVMDLSYNESDRIYGNKWPLFLMSCKSVLGVESGSSVFDFSGKIQEDVEEYTSIHPKAEFEEVFELFLTNVDGKIKLNQISPRFFEAIYCKTLLILFEGEYSGILTPWKHYVPLKKDFSNIDKVLSVLRDPVEAQKIIDTAYSEIIKSGLYSYEKFIKRFDSELYKSFFKKKSTLVENPYSKKSFFISLYTNPDYLFRYMLSSVMQSIVLGFPIVRKNIFRLYFTLPTKIQKKIRPIAKFINK